MSHSVPHPARPRCDKCGKSKRYICGDWACITCNPQSQTLAAKRSAAKLIEERRKEANGVGYRNRVSDSQAQQRRILAVTKPPKPPWEPVWAAQSTPEIVAAVREARAAQRRLGVGR